jgi:hypothetical protein
MALIGRIFVVIGGYLLACVAAALVLTLGTLTPEWDDMLSVAVQTGTIWPVVGFSAAVVAAVTMLPAMLILALAEGFGWRSVLIYAGLGGGLALLLYHGLGVAEVAVAPDGRLLGRERELMAAAGIAGGLVYWLAAGRRAGAWRAQR